MENDETKEVEEVEELPEVKEGEEDTTDYKALALKFQGMAKRFQTRTKKMLENPPKTEIKKEEPVADKKEVLDRIDRAVLTVRGITEPDEIELVEKRKKETGRGLEELLSATWFKQELAEHREKYITDLSLPKDSKRSSQVARDSVEYWIQKGELPPRSQVQLRRDVVNARMKKAKDNNVFSDNPIA